MFRVLLPYVPLFVTSCFKVVHQQILKLLLCWWPLAASKHVLESSDCCSMLLLLLLLDGCSNLRPCML
jgi:hypothetical protein